MALAQMETLKSELQQQRAATSVRAAARVEACPYCPDLQDQLRKRTAERAHWQRQHRAIVEELAGEQQRHAAELKAQEKKHEKKHEKIFATAGRTVDYARSDMARLKEEKSKLMEEVRTATRTMKDYMKELGQEKNLTKKLTESVEVMEAEILKLRALVDSLEKFKWEVEREIESSDDDRGDDAAIDEDACDEGSGDRAEEAATAGSVHWRGDTGNRAVCRIRPPVSTVHTRCAEACC